jgi:serine/threonine protein kinase
MRIDPSCRQTIRSLGSGSYGSVTLDRLDNGSRVAVKTLNTRHLDLSAELTFIRSLAPGDYKHLVRVYGIGMEPTSEKWQICYEYCEGGSLATTLHHYIESKAAVPEQTLIRWGRQLMDAITVLNSKGFVHRDLSPRNIFFTDRGIYPPLFLS